MPPNAKESVPWSNSERISSLARHLRENKEEFH